MSLGFSDVERSKPVLWQPKGGSSIYHQGFIDAAASAKDGFDSAWANNNRLSLEGIARGVNMLTYGTAETLAKQYACLQQLQTDMVEIKNKMGIH